MCALFYDVAISNDANNVSIPDGWQAVSDNKGSTSLASLAKQ